MANIVMAHIVMAYVVMAYIVVAYIVVAYVVVARYVERDPFTGRAPDHPKLVRKHATSHTVLLYHNVFAV